MPFHMSTVQFHLLNVSCTCLSASLPLPHLSGAISSPPGLSLPEPLHVPQIFGSPWHTGGLRPSLLVVRLPLILLTSFPSILGGTSLTAWLQGFPKLITPQLP